MTTDEHLQIADVLGIPRCCAEQFVRDLADPLARPPGDVRGEIVERRRSRLEVEQLIHALHALNIPFVKSSSGWTLWGWGDFRKNYVPCSRHMYTAGWRA